MKSIVVNRTRAAWMLALVMLVATGCGSSAKKPPPIDGTADRTEPARETDDRGTSPVPTETGDMGAYSLIDINFDFDSADVRSRDREVLTRHGEWLSQNSGKRVLIEGHCDERGTSEYNLALGERRARAARDFLASYGVSASRLEVVSYGKEQPLDPRHDESAWAKNRRASFVQQ